ncbi:unnamed protein product [Candida verbasci]|uniref:21S rRNA pseudouridine(2819) synthase n=1 Tax=Candida verbasci TaxID=1227364 RepID=A0A9W4TR84_9ASCO|nr:unnamed protein product [Candida verbasci]
MLILKKTFNYLIVNKPSGIICDTKRNNNIIQLIIEDLKKDLPFVSSSQFRIVQRLDKYVTGGLIIARNGKFAKKLNIDKDLVLKKYVGLIGYQNELKSKVKMVDNFGIIENDVVAYNERSKLMQNYNAKTHFKLLPHMKTKSLGKNVIPIIIQIETGRKNQIRDHIYQNFTTTLLNDDKFPLFKTITSNDNSINLNSEIFKSNQIGLHCGYLKMGNDEYTFPLIDDDQELWSNYITEDGQLMEEIKHELIKFEV